MIEQGGRGGVADYTGQLVAALAAAGVRVELATATDHRIDVPAGVAVRPVFPYLRGGTPLRDALRRLEAQKVLNALGYVVAHVRLLAAARRADVVHVQGGHFPPLVLLAFGLLRLAGTPLVWTPHNTFERSASGVLARVRRALERFPARVVVHAQADLPALAPGTRAKAVVVPHGEYGALAAAGGTAPSREAARRRLGLPADATVVLCFGQLRPDKGIADVLAAARAVAGVHVVLAGEDLGALRDVRADDRVLVRGGFQSLEDAAVLFGAADVAALAYRRASASGVLLLAYGFATPVVAYPVGGLPEVVRDGETGWLCADSTVDALADAFRRVTRAEAERRGAAAQRFARTELSWERIAGRTRAVYDELA